MVAVISGTMAQLLCIEQDFATLPYFLPWLYRSKQSRQGRNGVFPIFLLDSDF